MELPSTSEAADHFSENIPVWDYTHLLRGNALAVDTFNSDEFSERVIGKDSFNHHPIIGVIKNYKVPLDEVLKPAGSAPDEDKISWKKKG